MDFKFTFEDGSEVIAHYGVKGMKWRKHKFDEDDEPGPDMRRGSDGVWRKA